MKTNTQKKYEKAFKELINSKTRIQPLRELQENMDFVLKALEEQAEELHEVYTNNSLNLVNASAELLQAQKEKFEGVLNNLCLVTTKSLEYFKEHHTTTHSLDYEIDDIKKRFSVVKEALNNQSSSETQSLALSPQNTIEKSMPRSVTSQDVGIAQKKLGDVSGNEDKTPSSDTSITTSVSWQKNEDRGSNICKNCGKMEVDHLSGWGFVRRYCSFDKKPYQKFTPKEEVLK